MPVIPLTVTQNFLDPNVIDKVFTAKVHVPANLDIVEIGAGTGNITTWLAKHTRNTILAFELDTLLATQLKRLFAANTRVVILEKNFLQSEGLQSDYTVVANIPFMFTTSILKQLADDSHFKEGYIILQREAAYRFAGRQVSQPGGIQSTLFNLIFESQILHTFAASDFTPAPQVTSVLLHIKRKTSLLDRNQEKAFSDFISYLFNKSIPIIRRAPLLGRYLARRIDYGRLQLLRQKPSELQLEDILYLFTLCDEQMIERLAGYGEKIQEEGNSVKKIFRSRNASNWRNVI